MLYYCINSACGVSRYSMCIHTLRLLCTSCKWPVSSSIAGVNVNTSLSAALAIVSKRGKRSLLIRSHPEFSSSGWGLQVVTFFSYKPTGPLNENESRPQPIDYDINFDVKYFTLPTLPTTPVEWKNTNWTSWWNIWKKRLAQSSKSTCPRALDTFWVLGHIQSLSSPFVCITQLSTSVLSTILPSVSRPALFSALFYQTQPSGRIPAQPWSVIKGWLWSAASQLKTLHKLPHIMFYSALFRYLNYNF